MKFNIYQIIGAIIYIIVAGIIIITLAINPNVKFFLVGVSAPSIIRALIIVVLSTGILYALVFFLSGVLGTLFQVKDKEYKKKDDKHMMKNDFTDMFNSNPKKKN